MSIESILFLVVLVLLSGITNWLQKRKQPPDGNGPSKEIWPEGSPLERPVRTPTSPRSPMPPSGPESPAQPPVAPRNWEEELRRLLEGEPPVVSAPPPPPATRSAPAPPTPVAPRPARPERRPLPTIVGTPLPSPARPAAPVVPPPLRMPELEKEPVPTLARLEQASQAYSWASRLHVSVAERMRRIDQRTERHEVGKVRVREAAWTPEVAAARSLFVNPRTARQAVVVSVILGSPKAFEGD